jgi:hypothetical protein
LHAMYSDLITCKLEVVTNTYFLQERVNRAIEMEEARFLMSDVEVVDSGRPILQLRQQQF